MKKTFFLAVLALCYAFLLNGALKPVMALESNSTSTIEQQSETTNEIVHNIGVSLPHAVDYSNSDLLKYVRRGDILLEAFPDYNLGDNGTVAIVEGVFYDTNYEQEYIRLIEVTEFGVSRGLLTPNRFANNYGTIYRVKDATEAQIEYATLFCESQLGKDFRLLGLKSPFKGKESWYPSELIWAAYYWQHIQLDSRTDEPEESMIPSGQLCLSPHCIATGSYITSTSIVQRDKYTHQIECGVNTVIDKHIFRQQVEENTYQCVGCGYITEIEDSSIQVNLNCHTHKKDLTENCEEGSFLLFDLNVE